MRYLFKEKRYKQLHICLFYLIATSTVVARLGYILSEVVKPEYFAPTRDYLVDCIFSMLQYQFFLQQICSFYELSETLITYSGCQGMLLESSEYRSEKM